jgi:hypothetical protein
VPLPSATILVERVKHREEPRLRILEGFDPGKTSSVWQIPNQIL